MVVGVSPIKPLVWAMTTALLCPTLAGQAPDRNAIIDRLEQHLKQHNGSYPSGRPVAPPAANGLTRPKIDESVLAIIENPATRPQDALIALFAATEFYAVRGDDSNWTLKANTQDRIPLYSPGLHGKPLFQLETDEDYVRLLDVIGCSRLIMDAFLRLLPDLDKRIGEPPVSVLTRMRFIIKKQLEWEDHTRYVRSAEELNRFKLLKYSCRQAQQLFESYAKSQSTVTTRGNGQ